jgi:hypothetical protein
MRQIGGRGHERTPPSRYPFVEHFAGNRVDRLVVNCGRGRDRLSPGAKFHAADSSSCGDSVPWRQSAAELWTNFADFHGRAAVASKLAFDASNAKSSSEFRALIAQLRTACNSCHALYQKTD